MLTTPPLKGQCGVGTACHGCGRRLPLHMADYPDEAALWECVHCQTAFAGVLSPEVLRMLSRRIRLAALHFDVADAEPLTDAVLHVVWQNAYRDKRNTPCEIRRSRRISGHREVVALRLDERYVINGAAVNGVVANLSRHGQMLVTTAPIQSPSVITQFQNAQRTIQLVGRVVWSRYLDVGCYGSGIDFIARFGRNSLE
jgi:hypothetical protein